ncbi:DUF6230 family protein [Williamsia deligens]|uniref:DUF6230 family protein n=1 Tax=Williamsia deligens TaxID=321325 RepID=A0ABW3G5Q2_9NOCA|nr:DUF6230 family protein [Williamsia deligens]
MNVAISGQPFTATIARADARSITLFPRSIGTAAGSRSSIAILMQSVTLTDLCMSTVAHVPVVGDVTMFLRVPGTGTTADRIVADVSDLGGSIGVRDTHLGVDVSTVGEVKGVATAGIVAGGSVMTTARLTGLSFTAEQLSMRRFDLDVRRGSHTC